MAKCKKCGEHYISKECPYCNTKKYGEENKKRKIGRIETKIKQNEEENKKRYIIYTLITIIAIFMINKITTPKNILIGKWRPINKTFGNGEIEFTEDKEYTRGLAGYVDYEVEKNRVIVDVGGGLKFVYKIIDENTISQNLLGIGKIIYKRIE